MFLSALISDNATTEERHVTMWRRIKILTLDLSFAEGIAPFELFLGPYSVGSGIAYGRVVVMAILLTAILLQYL